MTQAIEEAGLGGKAQPCDYLNFYCLGIGSCIGWSEPDLDYGQAQANRRFLIYVHAKIMIGKIENLY